VSGTSKSPAETLGYPTSRVLALVEYDAVKRRLWILGQRCHHGATGALLAAVAVTGLAVMKAKPRNVATLFATGGVLMAHDWKDRRMWFEVGRGNQP
jgi:hypothetical protein